MNEKRNQLHRVLKSEVLFFDKDGICTIADKDSKVSRELANSIAKQLSCETREGSRISGQRAGSLFEKAVEQFVFSSLPDLLDVRPGLRPGEGLKRIDGYYQFFHLQELAKLSVQHPEFSAALGSDYVIKPDIVVARVVDEAALLELDHEFIESSAADLFAHRKVAPLLHASISAKWTMRLDRVQNARAMALNLMRNRKGRVPHICVVTAEPVPARLASIALGTGDIDCVYHAFLPELLRATQDCGYDDARELLNVMVDGRRLKDIADLPWDLAV